ncbi:MAG TPA: hypothetical protein V6D06_20855 [Trichocoleus sp.]
MTFNIHLLDGLSYDEVEPLLEDYIADVIDRFLQSDTGQAYVKDHPEGGHWIGTFIEMAYVYGELTLPKMTKGDVRQVMEQILPRKLTLMDPSDADDAVEELIAFWTFIQKTYRLRSAGAIVKYLQSIGNQFPKWMVDPNRGGMAKSFFMEGVAAGYDMTTEEGLQALQAEYNQRLQQNASEQVPMVAPPPELQRLFDQIGLKLPEAGQMVDPQALMNQVLGAMMQPGLLGGQRSSAAQGDLLQGMRMGPLGLMEDEVPLSEDAIATLQSQAITETEPGTILQDFQAMLDLIEAEGIPVSGKRFQFALKLLPELNQRLSRPIQVDLKRPQQKSYPNLHGLYLLLRATGLAMPKAQGKETFLVLNPEIYASWQRLNPTERYCTLLEAWLVRGTPDMLGEDRSGPFTPGISSLQAWPKLAEKKHTYRKFADQNNLTYWPGYYNIALMEMFGLVKIKSGKPESGKGWRINQLEALPFGKALMLLLGNAFIVNQMVWPSETDATLPLNELQPTLQPYFPEWWQTLTPPKPDFRPGRHIFKVSLQRIWRRIAIAGDATLADLSSLILDSVDFDHDHLDMFTYADLLGRRIEVFHPYAEGDLLTDQVKIGSLPLTEGSVMQYLFDFGDCWEFQVQLETVESEPGPEPDKEFQKVKQTKRAKKRFRKPSGEILEVHGKSPEQYPSFDDDW